MKMSSETVRRAWLGVIITVAAICVTALIGSAWAAPDKTAGATVQINGSSAVADELLVKFRPGLSPEGAADLLARSGFQVQSLRKFRLIDWCVVRIRSAAPLADTMAMLNANPDVIRAEPNYIVHALVTPNDEWFKDQWGLHNTGQSGGTVDADIDAPEAWDVLTDSSLVIVAVIDTGVDYNHEDLAANMWTNPGEIPDNGADDDLNGYTDDYLGWNFHDKDNDPMDPDTAGHGTHVAGIIGAVGNNALIGTGVCWSAQIMPLKFLDENGSGFTSDAIDALEYAALNGANVINNSWGGYGYSAALKDSIAAAGGLGCVVVCAAGNEENDNDGPKPAYPASYDNPEIISVAASTMFDGLVSTQTTPPGKYAWGSNYGRSSVDLAAPGIDILSTLPKDNYGLMSGTSMAAPFVSGACALVWAQLPSLTNRELKEKVLLGVDTQFTTPPDEVPISGKVLTNGRLNVFNSLGQLRIVSPSPLPRTILGEDYSFTFRAEGGTTPYVWSVEEGVLPIGLVLDPFSGELSGAVGGTAQEYELPITVTDSAEPNATHTKTFILIVEGSDKVILRVRSWPLDGVAITGASVPPPTQESNTTVSGYTPYEVVFAAPAPDPAIVSLTAPLWYLGKPFSHWALEGYEEPILTRTIGLFMGGTGTVTAVYNNTPIADLWVNDDVADTYYGPLTVAVGDDLNNGLSPEHPKRHIQAMLDNPPIPLTNGVRILVSRGTYAENIRLLPKHSGIKLLGAGTGADGSVLDGNMSDSVIRADGWRDGQIVNFAITNGLAQNGGGIRFANGCLATVTRCQIYGNKAEEGAGIAGYSVTVTLKDNVISDNEISVDTGEGGAIYFSESYLGIYGNKIYGHTAKNGGGIRCFLCDGSIERNWIYNNVATNFGGGIFAKSCLMDITSNDIGGDTVRSVLPNMATAGGGIYAWQSGDAISSNIIENNIASTLGGGVFFDYYSTNTVAGNEIINNRAGTHGGGIACSWYSAPTILSTTIAGNRATQNGGGIYMTDYCRTAVGVIPLPLQTRADVVNLISSNIAGLNGGAIAMNKNCSPTVMTTDIDLNVATASGGAIYMWDNCSPVIGYVINREHTNPCFLTMTRNSAGLHGGGVYVGKDCTPTIGPISIPPDKLYANFILECTAAGFGGGIYLDALSPSPIITNNYIGTTAFDPKIIPGCVAVKGGGIYCASPTATIGDGSSMGSNFIWGNKAEDLITPANAAGGGICFTLGNRSVVHANAIELNTASYGGGIYLPQTTVQLLANYVLANDAAIAGGGIMCLNNDKTYMTGNQIGWNSGPIAPGVYVKDSSPWLYGNSIHDHILESGKGAGMRCEKSEPLLERNLIQGNEAPSGGGFYEEQSVVVFRGNTFHLNIAEQDGGGAYITSATVTFDSTTPADQKWPNNFINNSAEFGGGLYVQGTVMPEILRTRFGENRAFQNGGGIFLNNASPIIRNLLFVGNSGELGAGIYCYGANSRPSIGNCTFVANFAHLQDGGGGIFSEGAAPSISNCILWGNEGDLANCTATYSDVEDGSLGVGNIKKEPLFRGPGYSNVWQDPDPEDDIPWRTEFTDGSTRMSFVSIGIVENQFAGQFLNANTQQNVHFYITGNTASGEGLGGGTDIWIRGWSSTVCKEWDRFQIWDFHLQSRGGRWRYTEAQAESAWPTDPASSPCINGGDPADAFGLEPSPNGGIINQGFYGNTEQASKTGVITGDQFQHGVVSVDGSAWKTITFPVEFDRLPVVVVGPPTERDPSPGVIRIRNVRTTSFQIIFQRWPYVKTAHRTEKVHWLAMVKGIYPLATINGPETIMASTFPIKNCNVKSPTHVAFPQAFPGVPTLLTQIQTRNETDAVTDRITRVLPTSFDIAMQEQMSRPQVHRTETMGYIAITRGVPQIAGMPCHVSRTSTVVTHDPYIILTSRGPAAVRVNEEQSQDTDIRHASERVGFISFDPEQPIIADMQTCRDRDTATLRSAILSNTYRWERGVVKVGSTWKTVTLRKTYLDPIIIADPATYNDRAPGVVRIRKVGSRSFAIRFQNWSRWRTQTHRTENVAWAAIERGIWKVNTDQTLIANSCFMSNTNVKSPSKITFPASFGAVPTLVATQQTANDSAPVAERLSAVATSSFRVALQEEATGPHAVEKVGYVALGEGSAGIGNGTFGSGVGTGNPIGWKIVRQRTNGATSGPGTETIGYISLHSAYFVADLQTSYGTPVVTLRCIKR